MYCTLHKLPLLRAMMHVMWMSYQRVWQHQQCKLQCRLLRVVGVVGSGSASSLVSGISALQNLDHLEIGVGNSLGTIGKLRALTELSTRLSTGISRAASGEPQAALLVCDEPPVCQK